jgi:ATPase subunit of ABC transporter with duplicated ATPase domains
MIRLDSVSKQHGSQILFLEASMGVFRGDKVGLVGPNGSGKSTIFRMIVKEEQPDAGQVSVDRGITIGYFSQDVGEMQGRSVVEETMAGAGEVAQAGAELHALEHAMADPERQDELDALIERFGVAQARFDQLGGYALESRAREILAGLGFRPESIDDDVGKLSGGFKMRVALARILLMKPDALLLDEPTNHLDIESIIWLERFLREFDGALVLTSHDREFMNRLVTKIVEIDGGDLTTFTGNYDFYDQQRAVLAAQQEAQFARQQAMLKKEEAFIAKFKARASHAAQVQSRVKKLDKIEKVEPPKRRKVVEFEFKQWRPNHLRRARSADPPSRALVRHGRQRRGQIDPAQINRRRRHARRRRSDRRCQRQARLLRATLDGAAGREENRVRVAAGGVPAGVDRIAAHPRRCVRVFG